MRDFLCTYMGLDGARSLEGLLLSKTLNLSIAQILELPRWFQMYVAELNLCRILVL